MSVKLNGRSLIISEGKGILSFDWYYRLIYRNFFSDVFITKQEVVVVDQKTTKIPVEIPAFVKDNELNIEIVPYIWYNNERQYFYIGSQSLDEIELLINMNVEDFYLSDKEMKRVMIDSGTIRFEYDELAIRMPFKIKTNTLDFSIPVELEVDGIFKGNIVMKISKALLFARKILAAKECYKKKEKTKAIQIDIIRIPIELKEVPMYVATSAEIKMYYGIIFELLVDLKIKRKEEGFFISGPLLIQNIPI